MTDFPDPELQWHEVFYNGFVRIDAAEMGPGCLVSIDNEPAHFVPGVRIKPMTGDMDRARLVMRER